jgi:hypothetical protein
MDLVHYHRLRTAVQDNAFPGQRREVVTVETALRDLLMASGVFEEVEVGHTDDPDQLVIALCTFDPWFSEPEIAQIVERIWRERVSYPFWEAHGLLVDAGHVELEAASRQGQDGHYVTIHLVAQRARVPGQRPPSD